MSPNSFKANWEKFYIKIYWVKSTDHHIPYFFLTSYFYTFSNLCPLCVIWMSSVSFPEKNLFLFVCFCFQMCTYKQEIFIWQSSFLLFHVSALQFGFAQLVANKVDILSNSHWRKSSCSLTLLSPAHKSCTFAEREQILLENTHGVWCSRGIRLGPVYWLGK